MNDPNIFQALNALQLMAVRNAQRDDAYATDWLRVGQIAGTIQRQVVKRLREINGPKADFVGREREGRVTPS